jgi:ABC-type sugar transport system substrate-binding protein
MKKMSMAAIAALAFLLGAWTVKADPQTIPIPAKAICTVPKSYGDFKGMTGSAFIFEDSADTIKTLTCDSNNKWTAQIEIRRQ